MMKPARNALDVNIFVTDIKASLNFYQNLLGLTYVREVTVKFGTMHVLQFGESLLRLFVAKPTPPKGPAGLSSQTGYRCVVFPVQNISEICSKLQAEDVHFIEQETEILPGIHMAMVKDPDGNAVEFLQRS
ncbi:MAG: VOC family protein [Desulfobacteraceae bacterium]|nr:VOC family protein [Desulfobacteraceae bacterium]